MSQFTDFSDFSLQTQAVFDAISKKIENDKNFKLQDPTITEKTQLAVWEAFGQYILSQYKQGRAIMIPKFGIFTFTWPEVNLTGTTNEIERNKEFRKPLFLISKDFGKGMEIKPGQYVDGGITPVSYSAQTGKIPQVKVNLTEIAELANTNKDVARLCLERIFREFYQKLKTEQNHSIDIPYLGTLIIRNRVAAVRFDENIQEDVKGAPTRNLLSKSLLGFPNRFENLPSIAAPLRGKNSSVIVEESAQSWLKRNLDIDVTSLSKTNIRNKPFASTSTNKRGVPHVQPQEASNSYFSLPSNIDLMKSRLQVWIMNRHLSVKDAFYELVTDAQGIEINSSSKLSLEDFQKAVTRQDIKLSKKQLQEVFTWLDIDKDGFISVSDWIERLEEKIAEKNYLAHSLKYLNLENSDSVLKRLHIEPNQNIRIRKEDFTLFLSKIDPTLSAEQIESTAEVAFHDREIMETADLVDFIEKTLQSQKKEVPLFEIKKKVSQLLKNPQKLKKLETELQTVSPLHILEIVTNLTQATGKNNIDTKQFQTIAQSVLGLTKEEANKLANYLDTKQNGIDIPSFINQFSLQEPKSIVSAHQVAIAISNYMKINKRDYPAVLKAARKLVENEDSEETLHLPRKNYQKIEKATLAKFLQTIIKDSNTVESSLLADAIDIDEDGYISREDLETFVGRTLQLGEAHQRSHTEPHTMSIHSIEPLKEKELNRTIFELRKVLDRKKMGNIEFFKKLDANEDGFITLEEFCTNIDKVIVFPQTVKEGFFASMDKLKIGMIDYKTYLKTMQKSLIAQEVIVSEDSFDWCVQTLKNIRHYFESRNVNKEDAFKIVDLDFDGNISKEDLKNFLLDVLKLENEVTDPRLDRLFKLLDQYKRGYVQSDDFKRVFSDDPLIASAPSSNLLHLKMITDSRSSTILSNKTYSSAFDWKVNAKQQIGLVLSKKFPSLEAAFTEISGYTNRIIYKNFINWAESTQAFQGFNLTDNLLLHFFSSLDPHKKGYLTYTDFEHAFGSYNWNSQLLTEIQNVIYTNFNDIHSAFLYFAKNDKKGSLSTSTSTSTLLSKFQSFSYDSFADSINSLLPKRFTSSDIMHVWKKFAKGSQTMNYSTFCEFFEANKFKSSNGSLFSQNNLPTQSSDDISKIAYAKSIRQRYMRSLNSSLEITKSATKLGKPDAADSTFEWLKQIIRSSSRGILELFKEADPTNTGKITPIEFKNVINKLNLSLSSYEVNLLLDYCDVNPDRSLNWMSFVNRIQFKEADSKLFQRCKAKLKRIKDNIYTYMLTPRDAFMQFNKDGSGKLTYEKFSDFILTLSTLAQEEAPAFSTIKDLFDFIDMKKDGIIDINEWTQTFNQLPILDSSVTDNTPNRMINFSRNFLSAQKSDWENTKNYDEVMRSIGRNRKLLYNMFCSLEQRKVAITFDEAKKLIAGILSSAKVHMEEKNWNVLLKFAEKEGVIDYRLLIDVYRDRINQLDCPPKRKVIYI